MCKVSPGTAWECGRPAPPKWAVLVLGLAVCQALCQALETNRAGYTYPEKAHNILGKTNSFAIYYKNSVMSLITEDESGR